MGWIQLLVREYDKKCLLCYRATEKKCFFFIPSLLIQFKVHSVNLKHKWWINQHTPGFFANFSLCSLTLTYLLPSFFSKPHRGRSQSATYWLKKLHSKNTSHCNWETQRHHLGLPSLFHAGGGANFPHSNKKPEFAWGMASPWAYWLIAQWAGYISRARSPAHNNLHNGPGACKGEAGLFLNLRRRRRWQRRRGDWSARKAEAATSGTAARDGSVGRNLVPLSSASAPKGICESQGLLKPHFLKLLLYFWRVKTALWRLRELCLRLRGCGAAGGAAWEHVILRGRALAAVVQLAGRWLRKRNIHFQDLMFLLDAIWVLDLIFLVLEGFLCVILKISHFSIKTFLLCCTPGPTSSSSLFFRFFEKLWT